MYNDINEFGIKVLNELGQEIKFYNTRHSCCILEEEMYDYAIYKSSQNNKSPPYLYKKYGRGSLRKTYNFPIYKSGNMQEPKKSIFYPIHKQQGRGVGSMLKKVNPFVRKLIQKAKPKLQKVIKKASPKLRKVVKRKIAPVLK